MSSPLNTKNSRNAPDSPLDSALVQADIFAGIFQREALRALYGSSNQLRRSAAQLRACLDRIDKLTEDP